MDEPNQSNQDNPIFDSLSQEPSSDDDAVAPPAASSTTPPLDLQNIAPSLEDVDLDQFQASRTQSLMKADLMNVEDDAEVSSVEDGSTLEYVEDDDEGSLASEYGEDAPVLEAAPGRAHECLEIRTPVEEFETYVRARIDTLTRLGEQDRVEITIQALELGKRKLARITGVSLQ
jgi:hypothetical protein